jgi:hypothetical protein|tara:strand:- start:324 stop:551 length:228 start_codon:yes stop_codon:yes gene_type:complete
MNIKKRSDINILMYPHALYRTVLSMGPQYMINVYTWLKMALWDAPYRIYLDIELEKMALEREFSLSESWENKESS